jgi:hypothetical protein
MLQRTLPAGFIAPCLPIRTDKLPSGGQWLHEIKHDGFRIIARKDGARSSGLDHRGRILRAAPRASLCFSRTDNRRPAPKGCGSDTKKPLALNGALFARTMT